ncbi:hypothetical protein NDU88_013093 [Pleurodeles waltl]|uniref:Uncharacterized protein n=1 Tax=Pleurodeles waltl TaxID=8319 RepID=A0AAV7R3N3_PLEWA|nr:hypothetical protein NDU88_013093 [Pleurodeles waltl]
MELPLDTDGCPSVLQNARSPGPLDPRLDASPPDTDGWTSVLQNADLLDPWIQDWMHLPRTLTAAPQSSRIQDWRELPPDTDGCPQSSTTPDLLDPWIRDWMELPPDTDGCPSVLQNARSPGPLDPRLDGAPPGH